MFKHAAMADNRKLMCETVLALIAKTLRKSGRYRAAILLGDLGDANLVRHRDGFQTRRIGDRSRQLLKNIDKENAA